MGRTAAEFSAAKAYAAGDLALYGGALYEFTVPHAAGAWNSAQVRKYDSTVQKDIDRIISGYEAAGLAAEYMATIAFSAVGIGGDRYRIVLSSAPDPR